MAKLVSPRAELTVLRAMCSRNKSIAGSLIAQTDDTYFYHEESKELYKAIRRHVIKIGHPPSYQDVVEDLRISEEARDHFKLSKRTIRTADDVDAAVNTLNRYRQTRGALEIADYINTSLKKSRVDAEALLDDVTEALTSVKIRKSMEDTIVHFGRNNSSRELVKDIIYGDNTENVIPTGLRTFDERNGGFMRGSLVTIGGNSGAGKTLVANVIAMNMAILGYSVLYVPLEMSKREMTARMLARISGIDLLKIILNKLTDREKDLINRRYRKFIRRVKEAGGRYTVFRPKEDMSLEEIYSASATYQCDAKYVDYLTLLKGLDGDDQWRQLGNATRYAKIEAENSNSVNVVLAQVSDEGKIRYSGAVREHSSNGWVFTADQESKEQGILKISQIKSRNQDHFPFTVKVNYPTMDVTDLPPDEVIETSSNSKKKSSDKTPPNITPDV